MIDLVEKFSILILEIVLKLLWREKNFLKKFPLDWPECWSMQWRYLIFFSFWFELPFFFFFFKTPVLFNYELLFYWRELFVFCQPLMVQNYFQYIYFWVEVNYHVKNMYNYYWKPVTFHDFTVDEFIVPFQNFISFLENLPFFFSFWILIF